MMESMSPKTHNPWTAEQEQSLRALYPEATWPEIMEALPAFTRTAIYRRAQKLGLARVNQGGAPMGTIARGEATGYEIGWLAGFIDGEGTLQLAASPRHGRTGTKYLRPFITVVNTDTGATEKAQALMGGHRADPRPDDLYGVRLSGTFKVAGLLQVLLPHLTVKKVRADLLIRYAQVRAAKPGRAEYGEEEQAIYEAFYHGSGRKSASREPRILNDYANPERSMGAG